MPVWDTQACIQLASAAAGHAAVVWRVCVCACVKQDTHLHTQTHGSACTAPASHLSSMLLSLYSPTPCNINRQRRWHKGCTPQFFFLWKSVTHLSLFPTCCCLLFLTCCVTHSCSPLLRLVGVIHKHHIQDSTISTHMRDFRADVHEHAVVRTANMMHKRCWHT